MAYQVAVEGLIYDGDSNPENRHRRPYHAVVAGHPHPMNFVTDQV